MDRYIIDVKKGIETMTRILKIDRAFVWDLAIYYIGLSGPFDIVRYDPLFYSLDQSLIQLS